MGEEKLFNVVFFRNNQVVWSQIFYELKIDNVYKKLGSYARMFQCNDYNIFEFNTVKENLQNLRKRKY